MDVDTSLFELMAELLRRWEHVMGVRALFGSSSYPGEVLSEVSPREREKADSGFLDNTSAFNSQFDRRR